MVIVSHPYFFYKIHQEAHYKCKRKKGEGKVASEGLMGGYSIWINPRSRLIDIISFRDVSFQLCSPKNAAIETTQVLNIAGNFSRERTSVDRIISVFSISPKGRGKKK